MRQVWATALGVLAWGAAAAAAAHPQVWTRYASPRHGFAIDYPAGTFVPEHPADRGDSRSFRAIKGGARFVVWDAHKAAGDTPHRFIQRMIETCAAGRASYAVTGRSFGVISCEQHGQALYAKMIFGRGMVTGFEMTYPTGERRRWAEALARMAESLRPARR